MILFWKNVTQALKRKLKYIISPQVFNKYCVNALLEMF